MSVINPEDGKFAWGESLIPVRLGRRGFPFHIQVHYSRGILQCFKNQIEVFTVQIHCIYIYKTLIVAVINFGVYLCYLKFKLQ